MVIFAVEIKITSPKVIQSRHYNLSDSAKKMKTILPISPIDFPDNLKNADFLLAASVTQTCTIEGITQAGIKGQIPLTPTLDAEFITHGMVYSMPEIASTDAGLPTPGLLTRAAHQLAPFNRLAIINLGMTTKAQNCDEIDLRILPGGRIDQDAKIRARELFEKGRDCGRNYTPSPNSQAIILGESTPAGTTTAEAVARALNYPVEGKFASSFLAKPNSIKQQTINKALEKISDQQSIFEKLSICGDNMLIFCAGFILEASHTAPVFLAGGTQMAAVLLILNRLLQNKMEYGIDKLPNLQNLSLITTQWIYQDKLSDIEGLLQLLDFPINTYYSDFSFHLSQHPALQSYDRGEVKEGVGAGAAIAYAYANGISDEQLTRQVESYLGMS